jgi:hypothetical protein
MNPITPTPPAHQIELQVSTKLHNTWKKEYDKGYHPDSPNKRTAHLISTIVDRIKDYPTLTPNEFALEHINFAQTLYQLCTGIEELGTAHATVPVQQFAMRVVRAIKLHLKQTPIHIQLPHRCHDIWMVQLDPWKRERLVIDYAKFQDLYLYLSRPDRIPLRKRIVDAKVNVFAHINSNIAWAEVNNVIEEIDKHNFV